VAELSERRRRLTLVAMCTGQGMILLDNTIVNVALPSIQSGLGVSPGNLEWVVNAYVLALATLILVGDRSGRKRVFLAGLTVFTAFSAACARARRPLPGRLPRPAGRRCRADGPAHARDPDRRVPRVPPVRALTREPHAERQREHDARGEQRLDDHDPPEAERGGLAGESGGVGGDPRQPLWLPRQPQQEAGAHRLGAGRRCGNALLQHGAEREQQRRGECEHYRHHRPALQAIGTQV
jgi:hypothetical protein